MRPIIAVLAAALCFSTTGTARALAGVDASSLAVGAARIMVGGALLGLVAIAARGRTTRPEGSHPPVQRSPAWVLVGSLGVLAYQPAFFLGTGLNGVAIGTVVALGSAPIATGILDGVVSRRLPSRRWLVATAVTLSGVLLTSGLVGAGAMAIHPVGILASVGAGASYALYTVAGKQLLDRSWPPVHAMGSIFGVAALLSVPVLLVSGTGWLLTPAGGALVVWLGVVTTAVAYLLFGWGLAHLPSTTVSTLTLAEPLSATLLGLVLLREQLSAPSLVGLVAIGLGLALLSLRVGPTSPVGPE